MGRKVRIDPLTRIEGHLAVNVEVENGKVSDAWCAGEMFRGFETILKGRSPMDAQQITQRICGVCPVSHGMASVLAQDMAYGVSPPPNGRLARNLILGANYIQSHIIHFYHLSALDFVDVAALTQYKGGDPGLAALRDWVKAQLGSRALYPAAPFLPRYDADYIQDTDLNIQAIAHYVEALDMRRVAHEAAAIFCGKMPHAAGLTPGGVTETVTPDKIAAYRSRLGRLRQFIDHSYLPDVLEVAKAFPSYFQLGAGEGNYLAYGVFSESDQGEQKLLPAGVVSGGGAVGAPRDGAIAEDVRYSRFSSASGLGPLHGETVADPAKGGAYSWLKAPRYDGKPMEVGPLARVLVAHLGGVGAVSDLVGAVLKAADLPASALNSALGRHAARAIECKVVADRCEAWIDMFEPGKPAFEFFEIPAKAEGWGLTEAPRGALGHWLRIEDRRIAGYQCVVPTTWNCSPRDDRGVRGPVEQALIGTPVRDEKNPIEAARVVRSFDPCIACAVH